MSPQEKAAKFQHLWNFINKHTATFWGESFIKSLQKACTEADRLRKTPRLDISILQAPLKKSQKRLFIFSTDHGVLIPQRSGAPFLAAPSPRIIQAIEKLASNDRNKVYLISGRGKRKTTGISHTTLCVRSIETLSLVWTIGCESGGRTWVLHFG